MGKNMARVTDKIPMTVAVKKKRKLNTFQNDKKN
jgi:hypothetical protein